MADLISWSDFEKVDMRVGTIIHAEVFPEARKPAYRMEIDFGSAIGIKRSSAQITRHYNPAELVNKQVIAVINFPPKKIAGFTSECLVLGIYDENNDVILLAPERGTINGQKIG